jgi:transposase
VRDLPIFGTPVELVVPRVRVLCPQCGPKLEPLSRSRPPSRVTERLAASVAQLCKLMSVQHVASFYGLAWTTVKLIDQRQLERESARDLWRLQPLRRWSHEQVEQVLT